MIPTSFKYSSPSDESKRSYKLGYKLINGVPAIQDPVLGKWYSVFSANDYEQRNDRTALCNSQINPD